MRRVTRTEKQSVPSRWVGRIGALVALASFGLAPLLGVAHLLLVQHTTCPLDGELIEIHDARTDRTQVAAGWEAATEQGSESHDHHHCEGAPHRVAPAKVQPYTQVASSAFELNGPRIQAVAVRPPAISLLFVAPKASPPV